jgi:hypothetical protein
MMIWIQAPDVRAEHAGPATPGVPLAPESVTEPWRLAEMQTEYPDGAGTTAPVPNGNARGSEASVNEGGRRRPRAIRGATCRRQLGIGG